MNQMRSPEVPKENIQEQTPDVVRERADILDATRLALEELSRKIERTAALRQERFVA